MVFVHGFGGERAENGLFDELVASIAPLGFAAVQYDWRGLGESAAAGDFACTRLPDHAHDFLRVIDWARSAAALRNASLHAVGFSLGAAVIGLAASCHHTLASVAYLSPAVRPSRSMFPRYDTPDVWNSIQKQGFAEKAGSSVRIGRPILESLRDTDLGDRAFALSPPLLVYQGSDDDRIPSHHTREVVWATQSAGAAVEYRELSGATHSFRPPEEHWSRLSDGLSKWLVSHSGNRVPRPVSQEHGSKKRSQDRCHR